MSRSTRNEEVANPCTRYFSWSGDEGTLNYYDKEKKERIPVELPFTFIVLDRLITIKGYNETAKQSVYANEIKMKDIKTAKMSIRSKKVELYSGTYKEVKDQAKAIGGKYTESVYIAYYDESRQLQIGNIQFNGSSFGGGKYVDAQKKEQTVPAWLEFCNANKDAILNDAIVLTKNNQQCKNGAVKFFCPSFVAKKVSPETDAKAMELDNKLQSWLLTYLNQPLEESQPQPIAENITAQEVLKYQHPDVVPFEQFDANQGFDEVPF